MGRVKTFSNGGSLLPGDLNSIEDDYEYAFATYKENLAERTGKHAAAVLAGTFVIPVAAGQSAAQLCTPGTNAAAVHAFYLDLADYLANTRTTKFRVRAQCFTNAVAPAANLTVGLYPVSTWAGGSGSDPIVNALGAVTAGSTVAFNAPGANAALQGNSGDFNAPAAGWYVLGVVVSANPAANSVESITAHLQMRQV